MDLCSEKIEIKKGETHLWVASPQEIDDEALLSSYFELMSDEEKKKQEQYMFEKHRHLYLITRALVRSSLSKYHDTEPADWKFVSNAHGKPEIANEEVSIPLRFNLSHTEEQIICGITLGNDLGVDVEMIDRRCQALDLANNFFSSSEIDSFADVSADEHQSLFYEYWTLKESYTKAKGKGLTIPLDSFTFHFHTNKSLDISFTPPDSGNAQYWKFWLMSSQERDRIAVAIQTDTPEQQNVFIRKTVPLAHSFEIDCEMLYQKFH